MGQPIISITKIEPDERAPETGHEASYHVNYQVDKDGETIEIEGTLKPYDTGRGTEYEFAPSSWFSDPSHEKYYDENHEYIQDEILAKFSQDEDPAIPGTNLHKSDYRGNDYYEDEPEGERPENSSLKYNKQYVPTFESFVHKINENLNVEIEKFMTDNKGEWSKIIRGIKSAYIWDASGHGEPEDPTGGVHELELPKIDQTPRQYLEYVKSEMQKFKPFGPGATPPHPIIGVENRPGKYDIIQTLQTILLDMWLRAEVENKEVKPYGEWEKQAIEVMQNAEGPDFDLGNPHTGM